MAMTTQAVKIELLTGRKPMWNSSLAGGDGAAFDVASAACPALSWAAAMVSPCNIWSTRLLCLVLSAGVLPLNAAHRGPIQVDEAHRGACQAEQDADQREDDAGVQVAIEPLARQKSQHDRHREGDAE